MASMIREILSQLIPGAGVTERQGALELRLAEGLVSRFKIVKDPDEVGPDTEPSVLWLDSPDPRTLKSLRDSETPGSPS